jgi:hypothetical protein
VKAAGVLAKTRTEILPNTNYKRYGLNQLDGYDPLISVWNLLNFSCHQVLVDYGHLF